MKAMLYVVTDSTHPGTITRAITEWTIDVVERHAGFRVKVLDLAKFRLPLRDEPESRRTGGKSKVHALPHGEKADRVDAVVFICLEHIHARPSRLIDALTQCYHEWQYKPVSFVSYGGISARSRAAAMVKTIASRLKIVPIAQVVVIPSTFSVTKDGNVRSDPALAQSGSIMVDELGRWAEALGAVQGVAG